MELKGGQCAPVGRGAGGGPGLKVADFQKVSGFPASHHPFGPMFLSRSPRKGAHTYFIVVIPDSYLFLLLVFPSEEIKENEVSPRGTHFKCPSLGGQSRRAERVWLKPRHPSRPSHPEWPL